MRGQIQRDGQRYKIELAEGGVALLPRGDIWRVERSLRELYDFRRQEAERHGGQAHFDLAKWCLQQEMYPEASVHLAIAQRAELDAELLHDLRARIEVAVSAQQRRATSPSLPARQVSAAISGSASKDNGEPPAHTTQLSPQALREFSTRIQPLLINRCGNATCHGRASQTDFQLTQPQRRGLYTPRLTQRNAAACAGYVNFAAPSASDLLAWSDRAHGGMTGTALNENQLETLRQWLTTVTGKSPTVEVAQRSAANTPHAGGLINPLDAESTLAADPSRADISAAVPDSKEKPTSDGSNDPFDPEAFNRQHHPTGSEP